MKWLCLLAFAFSACRDAPEYDDDKAPVFDSSLWEIRDAELLDAEDTVNWQCGGTSREENE